MASTVDLNQLNYALLGGGIASYLIRMDEPIFAFAVVALALAAIANHQAARNATATAKAVS
ncbi:hypothetical protein [Streptomyces sp. NPDC015130]|uniref:hypothetical protein n=1 Tax=Streptomyces sp. NPDC015130 TaxID=3364940 RepID=UPI0036F7A207